MDKVHNNTEKWHKYTFKEHTETTKGYENTAEEGTIQNIVLFNAGGLL